MSRQNNITNDGRLALVRAIATKRSHYQPYIAIKATGLRQPACLGMQTQCWRDEYDIFMTLIQFLAKRSQGKDMPVSIDRQIPAFFVPWEVQNEIDALLRPIVFWDKDARLCWNRWLSRAWTFTPQVYIDVER